jgi:hypothetical protein
MDNRTHVVGTRNRRGLLIWLTKLSRCCLWETCHFPDRSLSASETWVTNDDILPRYCWSAAYRTRWRVLFSLDVSEPWYSPLEYRCAWESFSEAFWRWDYVGFDGSVYRVNLDLWWDWQWHRQGWRDANVMYVLGAGYANPQHIRTATDQFNKVQVSNHRATARA